MTKKQAHSYKRFALVIALALLAAVLTPGVT